nr:MAG TPA: hypothetical protein [Caudoviricetes sp.]
MRNGSRPRNCILSRKPLTARKIRAIIRTTEYFQSL